MQSLSGLEPGAGGSILFAGRDQRRLSTISRQDERYVRHAWLVALLCLMVLVSCSEDNLSGSAADGRSWVRCFGGDGEEYGEGVAVSPGGDVYVTGYDVIDYHWHSQLLIKYDARGQINWSQTATLFNRRTSGRSVTCLSDDEILVAGDCSTDNGGLSFCVVKYTSDGDTLFAKEIANPHRLDYLHALHQTSDMHLVLVGRTDYRGISHHQIVKIDESGDVLWRRTFGGYFVDPMCHAYPFGCTSLQNGDIIIAGSQALVLDTALAAPHTWVICLNAEGTMRWQHSDSGVDSVVATDIIALADGALAYCYNSRDTLTGYWDTHVRVLDADGNELWGMDMPTADRSDYATTILEPSPGVFWLFGWTIDHGVHMPLMVQVNRNTNEWWVKSLTEPPPPSGATDAVLHPDGGVVMTGTCVSYSGGVQMWVRRF